MTPNFDQALRRWYWGQLAILIAAMLVTAFQFQNGLYFPVIGFLLVVWFLTALAPLEPPTGTAHWHLRHVNYYLQTILQFNFLPLLLANLVVLLGTVTGWDAQGLLADALVYAMIMFVPVAYIVMRPIESTLGRILMLVTAVFSGLIGAQATMLVWPGMVTPQLFDMVSNTGILGAFGFVLTVGVLMSAWQLPWPTWRLNKSAKAGWLAVIAVFGIGFVVWNGFSDGGTWATTFTKFDFRLPAATWKMFLSGLEPGIAEEWLYRFAVMTLLLRAFKNRRFQLDIAVWGSAGMFGLWHVTNAIAGQSWSATLEQMIFAAALGAFLAISYLYSGSLAVPMLLHAGIDIFSMMASGSQTMAKPDAFEWQTIIFTVIVFVGLTIIFLTGQRRRVMQEQANRLA